MFQRKKYAHFEPMPDFRFTFTCKCDIICSKDSVEECYEIGYVSDQACIQSVRYAVMVLFLP